jgi:hypothetical protein
MPWHGIQRLISGGQTGVDRAALDVAIALGVPAGGWCPAGRWAENGPIPLRYPLVETPRTDPAQRTEWNIRDSDGTLVVLDGKPRGGTALTIQTAARLARPLFILDLAGYPEVGAVRRWLDVEQIAVLNVAGPRESECPGIYARAYRLFRHLFAG